MSALVTARVFHARHDPRPNAFAYGVYYVRVSLSELGSHARQGLFSFNRFNLLSIRSRDYERQGQAPAIWVRAVLEQYGLGETVRDIALITMPRVLGYAFNPVSFFLCRDSQNGLRAVIALVNNTFGETHSYLCMHDDGRPIGENDWLCAEKAFHVSPFLPMEGNYRFRFAVGREKIAIWINYFQGETLVLATSLIGQARRLSSSRALYCFFRYPLVTLKVIGLIHYQAVKLFLKGIRHFHKPPPPSLEVTR